MTQEAKAKRYDEAIKVAENIHKFSSDPAEIKRMEQIFPELKESEDERIRKEIMAFLTYYHTGQGNSVKYDDDWIAWLEKQEHLTTDEYEQGKEDVLWCIKQARKNAKDENDMGTCWFAEKWLEKQSKE